MRFLALCIVFSALYGCGSAKKTMSDKDYYIQLDSAGVENIYILDSTYKKISTSEKLDFNNPNYASKPIKLELPKYTKEIIEKYQGRNKIFVKIWINEEGLPQAVTIKKSVPKDIVPPIIEAIKKSKFSPALSKTGPIPVWLLIPFYYP